MDFKSIKWFVSYKVPVMSGGKVHIAGPYASIVEAGEQATDIRASAGVIECKVYQENADELLSNKLLVD